jgi:hypothetical protein
VRGRVKVKTKGEMARSIAEGREKEMDSISTPVHFQSKYV